MLMRFAMMTLTAVAIACVSYRLGAMRHAPRTEATVPGTRLPALSAELPANHPLTVALTGADEVGVGPAERKALEGIALEFTQKRGKVDEAVRTVQQSRLGQLKEARTALGSQIAELTRKLGKSKGSDRARVQEKIDRLQRADIAIGTTPPKGRIWVATGTQLRLGPTGVINQLEEAMQTITLFESHSDVIATMQRQAVQKSLNAEYAELTFRALDPQSRVRVRKVVQARRTLESSKGFALILALDNREELGLSPRQVTDLQLLQAEFIREFAPIREQYETMELPTDRLVVAKLSGEMQTSVLALDKSDVARDVEVTLTASTVEIHPSDAGAPDKVTGAGDPIAIKKGTVRFVGRPAQEGKFDFIVKVNNLESAKELEGKLAGLERQFAERAYKVLSSEQQRRLKELVDQSLGPDR